MGASQAVTVYNHLRVTRSEEPIGFGTGLGGAWQTLVEVDGHIAVEMTIEDFGEFIARDETDLHGWLIGELKDEPLDGITPTQVVIDGSNYNESTVTLYLSVEDWENDD